jgi:hypothetical protein
VRLSEKTNKKSDQKGEKKMAKKAEEKTMYGGFDPKSIGEETLKFMKASFDATFDNVVKVQDLNDKMLKELIEKGQDVQAEAVSMVNEFVDNAKKGRDDYKKAMEEGFKKAGELLKTE